jgi:GNAT superfamily N-acetyltransferase
MRLTLRLARSSDIPAMHRLRLSVRENSLGASSGIGHASYVPFVDSAAAWVAYRDQQLAGFAAVERDTQTIWTLFVAPEAERQGVGSALLREMLSWAAGAGLDRLRLSTAAGTRAEAFYRAAGWREAGFTPQGELRFEYLLSSADKPSAQD